MNPFISTFLNRVKSESPWFYKILRKIALACIIGFAIIWVAVKKFFYPLMDPVWVDVIANGCTYVVIFASAVWGMSQTGTTTPEETDKKI